MRAIDAPDASATAAPTGGRARAAALAAAAAVAAGAAGALTRLVAPDRSGAERAAGVLVVVLAAAPACAAAWFPDAGSRAERTLRAAGCAVAVWAAGASAGLGAGGGAVGAACVPAAAALLACGIATVLAAVRVDRGAAAFAAAAIVAAPSAWIFVADPWIEWRGSDAATSPSRAQTVVAANPVASITSFDGGTGVDWLRLRLLYDGPGPGEGGLSRIGQYYAARETAPGVWAGSAGFLGLLLVGAPRRLRACSPASS